MKKNSPKREFHPSRKLGQNFLNDQNILGKIVKLAELDKNRDETVEIGPGFGSLTKHLASGSKKVFAIEKDRRIMEQLEKNLSGITNVELISEDALKVDYPGISESSLKLVANLPYSISTPLLFKIYEERKIFKKIIVMLQKEVGERICSGPERKSYGVLSVLFQNYFDTELNFRVKPSAFTPRPKVDSVVITLIPLEGPRFAVENPDFFKMFVKSAFSSRRKMIGNSLSGNFSRETAVTGLENAGIDPKRRAETLTVEEFAKCANHMYRLT